MKRDPYFKFVVVVVILGLLAALATPAGRLPQTSVAALHHGS
jgi:hypothetical protein